MASFKSRVAMWENITTNATTNATTSHHVAPATLPKPDPKTKGTPTPPAPKKSKRTPPKPKTAPRPEKPKTSPKRHFWDTRNARVHKKKSKKRRTVTICAPKKKKNFLPDHVFEQVKEAVHNKVMTQELAQSIPNTKMPLFLAKVIVFEKCSLEQLTSYEARRMRKIAGMVLEKKHTAEQRWCHELVLQDIKSTTDSLAIRKEIANAMTFIVGRYKELYQEDGITVKEEIFEDTIMMIFEIQKSSLLVASPYTGIRTKSLYDIIYDIIGEGIMGMFNAHTEAVRGKRYQINTEFTSESVACALLI